MIGISYLTSSVARSRWRGESKRWVQDRRYDHVFWGGCPFCGKTGCRCRQSLSRKGGCGEINTYEQLRELDENSDQLKSDAMAEIERVLFGFR